MEDKDLIEIAKLMVTAKTGMAKLAGLTLEYWNGDGSSDDPTGFNLIKDFGGGCFVEIWKDPPTLEEDDGMSRYVYRDKNHEWKISDWYSLTPLAKPAPEKDIKNEDEIRKLAKSLRGECEEAMEKTSSLVLKKRKAGLWAMAYECQTLLDVLDGGTWHPQESRD